MATENSRERGGGMSTIRMLATGLLIIVLILFILQNLETVEIDFLLFTVETSMLVAMVICALLGAVVALLFMRGKSR